MLLTGTVTEGDACYEDFPGHRSVILNTLTIWPTREWSEKIVTCFEADDVIVSSCFVAIHAPSRRLFIDQSYSRVAEHFPTRFAVAGADFRLETEPRRLAGTFVVLGGPIDTVWYHWLFNWAPRLLLLKRMRPDLMADPAIRIAVHPLALEEPYRGILRSFGIAMDRFVALDPDVDHRLERAVLVSFLDQAKLFPAIVQEMRAILLAGLNVRWRPTPTRRLLASRQALPAPKRRIANFAEVAPILTNDYGFQVISCGQRSAVEQASRFYNADLVLGGHGSDLANILFCRPGTVVAVIESAFNIKRGLHLGLDYLAEILGLEYRLVSMPTLPDAGLRGASDGALNEDYLIDMKLLGAALDREPAEIPARPRAVRV